MEEDKLAGSTRDILPTPSAGLLLVQLIKKSPQSIARSTGDKKKGAVPIRLLSGSAGNPHFFIPKRMEPLSFLDGISPFSIRFGQEDSGFLLF